MELALKRPDHIVPEYSLTGDLLSYSRCHLQYRYYNGSSLPPSRPVQLWYGEFVHGMMEATYRLWATQRAALPFPWPYTPIPDGGPRDAPPEDLPVNDIRVLGWPIEETLAQEGKQARSRLARRAAYRRAERAVNMLGPHLFPLISTAEQRVLGTRTMLPHEGRASRSNRYSLRGVIDVLANIDLEQHRGNVIAEAIRQACGDPAGEYEIVLDYKGARRPQRADQHWQLGEWQVQTYAWLRERQPEAKPVVAGILIYINELAPSAADAGQLQRELRNAQTDIVPEEGSQDDYQIRGWQPGAQLNLSEAFRFRRAIKVITVTPESKTHATQQFDALVAEIENAVEHEAEMGSISAAWEPTCREPGTCIACDFLSFCPRPAVGAAHDAAPLEEDD